MEEGTILGGRRRGSLEDIGGEGQSGFEEKDTSSYPCNHYSGHNVEALMGVKKLGEGILDGGKCENLRNSDNVADLVVGSKQKRASKSMKSLFMEKDWNKNEDDRKEMVNKLVDWHREQAIRLP